MSVTRLPVNKSFVTLNRTVRIVAAVLGVLAGIGIPVTYGVVAYNAELSRLTYRSELAARRVSEYAYIHGDTWRYAANRIGEFVAFYNEGERQTVVDAGGGVVAEHGPDVSAPTVRVSAPIMVQGREVGRVLGDYGIGFLYLRTAMLALFGIVLGAGVFAFAHYVPLRALRRATTEHEKIEGELGNQITQTRAALMEAQEATRAKSVFLATMSHEIRTPMNAVLGLSSALMETELDGEQRHLVETISESGQSLMRLLNDILDVSKLDAGKVTLEARAFSPAALLDQTVSILYAKAIEKGVDLRAVGGAELPAVVLGDEVRLRQVLINLADNAIKFTDKGSVEIAMSCREETAEQATIACRVRDTGIGIAADRIGVLFDEFTQADFSINRKYGGTGLGLAICQRIVEQMGGVIEVTSTPGVGTTFSFTLTFAKSDADALAEHTERAGGSDFAAVLARLPEPLSVLLAEDNGTNQLVFSRLVRSLNVELTIAENGQEAVELASERTFDVVFMDMRMPVMDGLAATRAIRALGGSWTDIPIVALTANAFAEDVKLCREAGMNDFIAKPIRKPLLLERLGEALKDHPLVHAAARWRNEAETAKQGARSAPATPAATIAEPVFDRAAFDELIDAIGVEGAAATLSVFVAETKARLARMRLLSSESGRALIEDEAHSLKGASGTLGMSRLSGLARRLERGAAILSPAAYTDQLDRLAACFETSRAEAERALLDRLAA
jgi:signal transduction histidine kinase/CheY-like chemotaxis protein/HPt (histidine-containing phosphotransfer) domain-containing protein